MSFATLLGGLWTLPATLWGLLCVVFGGADFHHTGRYGCRWYVARVGGWCDWYFLRKQRAAFTMGVIVVAERPSYATDASLQPHEERHVLQGLIWSWIFPLAYLVAGICAWAEGGSYYRDNRFEVDARGTEVTRPGGST